MVSAPLQAGSPEERSIERVSTEWQGRKKCGALTAFRNGVDASLSVTEQRER